MLSLLELARMPWLLLCAIKETYIVKRCILDCDIACSIWGLQAVAKFFFFLHLLDHKSNLCFNGSTASKALMYSLQSKRGLYCLCMH